MASTDDILTILDRIAQGTHTEDDLSTLRESLVAGDAQNTVQIGKYNITFSQGQDIKIGDTRVYQGMDAESIRQVIQQLQDEQEPKLSKQFDTVRRFQYPVILATVLTVLLVGFLVKSMVIDPALAPMPDVGGHQWNIAVAGIGMADSDGVASESDEGKGLSELIVRALQDQPDPPDHIKGWQDVGFITGNSDERSAQAAQIAQRTNAVVVIYGVIVPTTPGRARFEPSFYINEASKSASVYGAEILGPEQFGSPIDFVLDTDRGTLNESMIVRLDALRDFLNGLQSYFSEDFVQAKQDLQMALEKTQANSDHKTAAVIHEFLGALEIESGNAAYEVALEHLSQAHALWPDYSRPYLSKGAILYQLALIRFDLAVNQTEEHIPAQPEATLTPDMLCFEPDETPALNGVDYLYLSLRCYEEALSADGEVPTMDMEPKITFSMGNIYLLLSEQTEQDDWQKASDFFSQVIQMYDSSDERRKVRLRRIAAHAYARRGLITICYPDCNDPQAKPASEYQQAADDYRNALTLLQEPEGCREGQHCYPSDEPYIETYRKQLEQLNQNLDQSIEL